MKLKILLVSTFFLSIFGLFFLFFIKKTLVYYLYGYNLDLIGGYTVEAYIANDKTWFLRYRLSLLVIFITFFSFVISCIAVYKKHFLPFYLTQIITVINFLILHSTHKKFLRKS
jgi:hypothetical protein